MVCLHLNYIKPKKRSLLIFQRSKNSQKETAEVLGGFISFLLNLYGKSRIKRLSARKSESK